jgi:hypothetical protein
MKQGKGPRSFAKEKLRPVPSERVFETPNISPRLTNNRLGRLASIARSEVARGTAILANLRSFTKGTLDIPMPHESPATPDEAYVNLQFLLNQPAEVTPLTPRSLCRILNIQPRSSKS